MGRFAGGLLTVTQRRCSACQLLRINGVVCHETGCPEAWRDYQRECEWCGSLFTPEYRGESFCSEDCNRADYGEELPGELRHYEEYDE
jgi:hypothetical protein